MPFRALERTIARTRTHALARLNTPIEHAVGATARAGIIAAMVVLLLTLGACDSEATQETGSQSPAADEAAMSPSDELGAAAEADVADEAAAPLADAGLPTAEADAGLPGSEPAGGPPTSEAAALATARVAELLPSQLTAFGVSGSEPGQMMLPFDVAVGPEGDIYLSDSTGVQWFSEGGQFEGRIGDGEVLTALGGLAVGPDGTIYVTGFESQVLAYGPDGERRLAIGDTGTEPGQLSRPVDVAVDAAGDLYVADAENARVDKFAADGSYLMSFGGAGSGRGELRRPRAVAVAADGIVYVGEGDDFLIQRYSPDGEHIDAFGQGHADENIWRIGGIAIGDDGTVYATQAMSNRLQAFDPDADLTLEWEFGALGRGSGEFSTPMGLDLVGDQLFVADQQNNRIVVYTLKP